MTYHPAILTALLLAAACAHKSPEMPHPIIVPVEVAVPVAVACVPSAFGPAPEFPDSDAALLGAQDAADRYLLIAGGRSLRIARIAELETVIAGCR